MTSYGLNYAQVYWRSVMRRQNKRLTEAARRRTCCTAQYLLRWRIVLPALSTVPAQMNAIERAMV